MPCKARTLTALMLFLLIASGTALSQFPSFQFLQKPGPYPVGLKVVNQYDPSRQFPAKSDGPGAPARQQRRPLQTLIWYPALESTSKPMTVGDYVALADTEISFYAPDPGHNKWRRRLKSSFDVPLWAVRDAQIAQEHYPVLIYAPSDSSIAWENADLCEYLASHGYVVLASRSMGVSTRDMTDDLAAFDSQARDISFLITYAETLSDADESKVAVVSWSWGGISSLFAAARDPRIQVLAEMDGSMRYYPGFVAKAGSIQPEQLSVRLLFFTSNRENFTENIEHSLDAVFAADTAIDLTGDPESKSFRTTAEGSTLNDVKDDGVASLFPIKAAMWAQWRNAQWGLNEMTDKERHEHVRPFEATWVLLSPQAKTSFARSFHNSAVAVCLIDP